MPQRNNDLENYLYVAAPRWDGVAELREADEELSRLWTAFGLDDERYNEFEDQCRTKFAIDDLYASKAVVTAHQFFDDFKPIEAPFTILALCADGDTRTTVVREIDDGPEIDAINAAIEGTIPFYLDLNVHNRGFLGPDGGWLLGNSLWEFSDREYGPTLDELKLLLLDAADNDRRKFERLRRKFQDVPNEKPKRVTIPERVRIFVWRRDEGKCVECGSKERLEYDHIIPVSKGGSNTERNVQLLCEVCNRNKSDHI